MSSPPLQHSAPSTPDSTRSYHFQETPDLDAIVAYIDQTHLIEQHIVLQNPHLTCRYPAAAETLARERSNTSTTTDEDEDFDYDGEDTLIHNVPTQPELPARMATFSLRNSPRVDDTAPVWTHTKNPAVNHELDSLKAIWYTLKDLGDTTEPNSQSTRHVRLVDNNNLVFAHIRERASIIRIGAIKGWRAVPDSEVQQDFKNLNIEPMAAAQLAIAPTTHSFRGSSSGRGRRRSNKTTKK